MSIYVKHNNEIKSAIPYVKYNDNAVVPTSGWAKTGGELKQIWPPSSGDTVYIYDQATLEAFRDRVNAGETSLDALVIADFSLSGEWSPIADYISNSSLQYTGTFDGGGHTITGLTINSEISHRGLFGHIGSGGTVKNLNLASTSVTCSTLPGSIAGWNAGIVQNCTNDGDITATDSQGRAGGIIGQNIPSGTVKNCTNSGTVSCSGTVYYVGGIAGLNSGTVQNCTNSGTVNGSTGMAGGIVGWNSGSSTVENCTNSGDVSALGTAGGIIAYNVTSGTVKNCTNSGDVSASGRAGGIIGQNITGTVSGNTNTGTVTATGSSGYAGGIVGSNSSGSVSGNTNTGTVTGTNITTDV